MINSEECKEELNKQWETIEQLGKKLRPWKGIVGGRIFEGRGSPDEAYNLLLVLAYASVDELLDQMIQEGVFTCPRSGKRAPMLGTKMDRSRGYIKWKNYDEVYAGKEARNRLAHSSQFVAKTDCLRYMNEIKSQFVEWGVLRDPMP